MRTITKNLYSFSELSEQAKQTAIENFRNNDSEFLSEFLYQEAHESVKAFHNIFSTKEDLHSWLDVRTGHIDDVILELSGQRLATYIWNNYGHKLFKGKYYSLWSKTDRNYKHHKNGRWVNHVGFVRCCRVQADRVNYPIERVAVSEQVLSAFAVEVLLVGGCLCALRPEIRTVQNKKLLFRI